MIYGLNVEELLVGAVFGAFLGFWLHAWALLTIPLCSFLWAWTGAGHGAIWRKVGCPLVACMGIFLMLHHWQVWIGFIPMCIVLAQGYGIPDVNDPEGSPIGMFYMNKFRSIWKAHLATRTTIYGLLLLCFIPALF